MNNRNKKTRITLNKIRGCLLNMSANTSNTNGNISKYPLMTVSNRKPKTKACSDNPVFSSTPSSSDILVKNNIILNKVKNKRPDRYMVNMYLTEKGILVSMLFMGGKSGSNI